MPELKMAGSDSYWKYSIALAEPITIPPRDAKALDRLTVQKWTLSENPSDAVNPSPCLPKTPREWDSSTTMIQP
jgi:hypothetical protein